MNGMTSQDKIFIIQSIFYIMKNGNKVLDKRGYDIIAI